jgi:hypothetical protein
MEPIVFSLWINNETTKLDNKIWRIWSSLHLTYSFTMFQNIMKLRLQSLNKMKMHMPLECVCEGNEVILKLSGKEC